MQFRRIRRKGRELTLMALYALDDLPPALFEERLELFWSILDDPRFWPAFLASPPDPPHPLNNPPLWDLFSSPPLTTEEPPALSPEAQEIQKFARSRIAGSLQHLDDIDLCITERSLHWRLPRMARIDRNILRQAAYEMLFCPKVPAPVVINEALELARLFSTQQARPFINGILDQILAHHRPNEHRRHPKGRHK